MKKFTPFNQNIKFIWEENIQFIWGRVFRSPGVGAVMFALLPTLWVFVPTPFWTPF